MCEPPSNFSETYYLDCHDYETHRKSQAFRRREKGSWDFAALVGKFDSQFLARQYLNIVYACLWIRLGEIRHTEALRKIRGRYIRVRVEVSVRVRVR